MGQPNPLEKLCIVARAKPEYFQCIHDNTLAFAPTLAPCQLHQKSAPKASTPPEAQVYKWGAYAGTSTGELPHIQTMHKPCLGRLESPPVCTSPHQSGMRGVCSPCFQCGRMPKLLKAGEILLPCLRWFAVCAALRVRSLIPSGIPSAARVGRCRARRRLLGARSVGLAPYISNTHERGVCDKRRKKTLKVFERKKNRPCWAAMVGVMPWRLLRLRC